MMSRQLSSEASWIPAIVPGWSRPYCQPTPALLTRMSIAPVRVDRRLRDLSARRRVLEVGRDDDPLAARGLDGVEPRVAGCSSLRAVPTTFAPSRPKRSIVARPMPLLAPVMTATFSCRRPPRAVVG